MTRQLTSRAACVLIDSDRVDGARLGKIWSVAHDGERAVGQVNALLSGTHAMPWVTRNPEMPEWHLHLASIHNPVWQRMGAEMAMALADLSRSRSRMFCDTGNCGNPSARGGVPRAARYRRALARGESQLDERLREENPN